MIAGVGGASIAGPFTITEHADIDGTTSYSTTTGRTLNNSPISAGERALILLNVSQSNAGNWLDNNYTVTNTGKVFSLSTASGDCYQTADPVLGSTGTGGCIEGKIGDLCFNAGPWVKIVFCNISVGATTVADWRSTRTAANKGRLHHRLQAGIRRVRSFAALQPATAILNIGIFSMIGESDNFEGTSQAVWEAGFREMVAARTGLNVNWPWFVGKCTYHQGTTSTAVRAAQAAVVDNVTIFAGADTDDITDRDAEDVHFNNTGRDTAATRWKNVFTGHSW